MKTLKNVLITGVASGLGNATAKIFLSKGFKVIGIDLNPTRIQHENFIYYQADITDYPKIKRISEDLDSKGILIEILINNAGVFKFFPVTDTDGAKLEKYFGVNTIAPFHLIHCFLNDLSKQKGIVIQVSSENVKVHGIFQPYPASKVALEALSTAARQELKLMNVRMVLIRPGAIDTPLLNWEKYDDASSPYYPYLNRLFVKAMSQVSRPESPQKVANLIYRISQKKSPKRIFQINNSMIVVFLSLLPQRLQDWIMVKAVQK